MWEGGHPACPHTSHQTVEFDIVVLVDRHAHSSDTPVQYVVITSHDVAQAAAAHKPHVRANPCKHENTGTINSEHMHFLSHRCAVMHSDGLHGQALCVTGCPTQCRFVLRGSSSACSISRKKSAEQIKRDGGGSTTRATQSSVRLGRQS